MTDIQMYLVGGAVRDFKLGVKTKDYDYSVVVDPALGLSTTEAYAFMRDHLKDLGYKLFLETPEHVTIRAQFPTDHTLPYDTRTGLTADFVLARKEGPYSDGRRPDWTEVGTLDDDLSRRDFTVNAMALDFYNNLIDPFNGAKDLENRVLRAVGDAGERLTEDALRAFRAIRFAITKGFNIDYELDYAMRTVRVVDALENNISAERIKDELHRCLTFDTMGTLELLMNQYPDYIRLLDKKGIWLKPVMEMKK